MELLLLVLALVSACRGQDWPPEFCHNKLCPEFNTITHNEDFKERRYVATDWLSTKVEGAAHENLLAAHWRLKAVAGDLDTWPVLVSFSDGDYWLSWFIPPDTENYSSTDSVIRIRRPAGIVYVRTFGDKPSLEIGEANMRALCEDLRNATIACSDNSAYDGAFYDPYFSSTRHSEIWISAVNQ